MTTASLLLVFLTGVSVTVEGSAQRSGSISWLTDGETLAIANFDADSVTLVGTRPLAKLAEIPVGGHPRSVVACHDGQTLLVSLSEVDRLAWVDIRLRKVARSLPFPGGPFPLVVHPHSDKAYVAAAYTHQVSEIDTTTAAVVRRISVPPFPRGLSIARDGRHLYVVHFLSGELSVIDTRIWRLVTTIASHPNANLARSVALAPDERTAYVPHLHANVTNQRLQFDTTVFPVVSKFDLVEGEAPSQGRVALDVLGRPVNNPWDAVVSHDAARLYVVNAGSDDLQILDLGAGKSLAQIDVGNNPRGIVLSKDGRFAYVHNALSNDLSVIDTLTLEELRRVELADPRLAPDIMRGKLLFNSARQRSMSLDSWISCASCHPDGESDGRTWRFEVGPRKTPSLRGAVHTLPHNRVPNRDEVQDTESFIRHVMAGTGLIPGRQSPPRLGQSSAGRAEDADALAAYVASLRPRRSPYADGDAQHVAALARGREIFFSEQTRCSQCHPPPFYTDSRLARPWRVHDIGQGGAYDTPSLLGLYAATCYLHDGRAENLREVLTTYNRNDEHGLTSHLSDEEIDHLVTFLLSLPNQ